MKKILGVLIVAVFSMFMVSGAAMATPITIDFGTGAVGTGGTISSDLINANAKGAWIPIGVLNVEGSPGTRTPNGPYDLSSSYTYLSFDTSENWIKIADAYGVIFLSGKFTNFAITRPDGSSLKVSGSGPAFRAPFLLADFGIDPNTNWASFGFTIAANAQLDSGTNLYEGHATSTHIVNTSVPEPASMLLLGLGLVGIAGVRRMFKK